MGTPEEDARRRKYGLEPLPDEPVQGTPAPSPVAVAEPVSERDKTRSKYGNVISQDTQVPAVPTIQPTVIPSQVTPPQVTSPQITRDASGRKSQAELIEEYEARRAPAPGSVFEGREPLPFGERPPDRDPLGQALTGMGMPGRVGAAFTSEMIGLERALAEQLGIHGRVIDPLDVSPDTAAQRMFRGEAGADPGLREYIDQINKRSSERNAWQNFLLEATSDPLNIVPGVGVTQLGRRGILNVPPSRFGFGASNLISEAPPSIQRQIALRNAVQQMQNAPSQLAIPARAESATIPLSGEVFTPPVRGPVSPLPAEPSLILVTRQNPMGQRIVFSGRGPMRDAAQELGMRSDVQILPGNASPGEVTRAARRLESEVPAGAPITRYRTGGGQVTPRPGQRQLPSNLDPEGLDELRRSLRIVENQIANTPAPLNRRGKPMTVGPVADRLRNLNERAEQLRVAINATQGPVPRSNIEGVIPQAELNIPGVIRREPVTRISPSTQTMLPEGVVRPQGVTPPTGTQASFQRPAGIPIEASTPEEAARLRALVRESATTPEEAAHLAAVAAKEVPPDDPAQLLQKVSFPEGKPRLSDPPQFADEIEVATIRNRAARIAQALAQPIESLRGLNNRETALNVASLLVRNPIVRGVLRWTPALRNPHLFVNSPTQKAGLVRAAMIDDGRQKIVGLLAHARKFGNQEDLFGRTVESTGLIDAGNFKGHSVNEIAENPSKFSLTKAQRDWLDAMSSLEAEIKALYERNGIPITNISLDDVERYAGRVHVARILEDGTIIERGFVGSGGRLTGRTGAQQPRTFSTVAEAQKEGWVPLSYERSFEARAQSAYNKVVNQRASKWIQENLPSGVQLHVIYPGEPSELRFGERVLTSLEDFTRFKVEGPGSQQFIDDLQGMFPDAPNEFLKGINSFNAVQRMYSLAGDASLVGIQFITLAYRHTPTFGKAMGAFAETFIRAAINPKNARRASQKRLADNAALIQRSPGLLLSNGGLEFTEALGRGGLLSPEGLYKGENRILRGLGRIPGIVSSPLRPFQQAFESAMDDAGINLMKGLESLAGGDALKTRELVDYVNNMRGLSSSTRLGLTPNQRLFESAVMLAPRYRRAIAALHASVVQGGLKGHLARQAYMSLTAGTVSTYIGISFALGQAQGKTNEDIIHNIKLGLDPSKKQFLLWKAGTNGFGLGSKFTSDLRLISRIATDPGDVLDFDEFNHNIGVRWVRSQLSAAPSDAWDILLGEEYLGEPITRDFTGRPLDTLKSFGKILRDDVTFIWLQAMLFDGGTIEERIAKGGADFFGARAYPYPGPSYDDVANAMYGKDYKDLNVPGSNFKNKQQLAVTKEWEKMQSKEKLQEREERSDKYSSDRKRINEGTNLVPESRRNLIDLQQRIPR